MAPHRSNFNSFAQEPTLDSGTLHNVCNKPPAHGRGGAVIELHAFAAPEGIDATELTKRDVG